MSFSPEVRARRRPHITASDAPAILNLSPWVTPTEVWLEKVHPELLSAAPDDNDAQSMGRDMEEMLCQRFARLHGLVIHRDQWYVSGSDPLFACTYDAIVLGKNEAVEAKSSGVFGGPRPIMNDWGKDGTDHIPAMYLVQTLMQLNVKLLDVVHVPAFLGGEFTPYREYHITPDWKLIDDICAQLREWDSKYIKTKTPPPDAAISAEFARRIIRTPGKSVEVPADLLAEYKEVTGMETAGRRRKAELREQILGIMLDAEIGIANGFKASVKKIQKKSYQVAAHDETRLTVKSEGSKGDDE